MKKTSIKTVRSANKTVTIRDVAQLAEVGVGTVSRYLNGNDYVKEATAERISKAISELKFEPSTVAASLRGTASRTIGIVVPDISNPLFALILKKLEQRLRAARYTVLLTSPAGDPANELGIVESLLARRVEGMFLALCLEDNPQLEQALRASNRPIVIMDRYLLQGAPGVAHIMTDHGSGMQTAMEHLFRTGHKRIFMPHAENNRPGIERERAFREALDGVSGTGVTGIAVAGSQYTDFATQETLRQLDSALPPDAILVGHNQMLPRVLSALRERGLKVGRNISVISCDRTDVAEFYDPPIAGITRDLVKIGDIAFDLFRCLADGQREPVCRSVGTSYEPTMSVCQHL